MNKRAFLAAPLCLTLVACMSSGERDVEVMPARTLTTQVAKVLDIEFPSGQIRITPSTDGQLHASVAFFCNEDSQTCRANAEKARIVHEQQGEHSYLSFTPGSVYSTRHANLIFKVQVPDVERLNVKADAGDIGIISPTACMTVRAGAGDLSIAVPAASIGRADLDANFGDANLKTLDADAEGRRPLLVGAEVKWAEGEGSCVLKAKLQAGAISVRLLGDDEQ